MVAVAADDLAGVAVYKLCKFGCFIPELPARSSDDDKKTQFVASVHKGRIHRVMGNPYNPASGIVQAFGIAPLLRVGHGIAYISKILMPVGADELAKGFPIQPKAIFTFKFGLPDSDAGRSSVERFSTRSYARLYAI